MLISLQEMKFLQAIDKMQLAARASGQVKRRKCELRHLGQPKSWGRTPGHGVQVMTTAAARCVTQRAITNSNAVQ